MSAFPYDWDQESISEWAKRTFGQPGTNISVACRANEEMAELLRALSKDDDHPGAAEEIADVFIVLYRLASRLHVDIHEQVDRKMSVNIGRKWSLDGDGHGKHVRERDIPVSLSKKVTLREQVLIVLSKGEIFTATQVARMVGEKPSATSSLMKKMCDTGILQRKKGHGARAGYGYSLKDA